MAVDSGYGSPKPKRQGYTGKKNGKKSPVIGEGAGTGPRKKPVPGGKNPKPRKDDKIYKPPFIRAGR